MDVNSTLLDLMLVECSLLEMGTLHYITTNKLLVAIRISHILYTAYDSGIGSL
jgi:hypothetical protein